MTQIFKVPSPGLDPRGVDIDSNGVVWTALAASSHLASFDVRKCTDLAGPAKLDGSQCANGWSFSRLPARDSKARTFRRSSITSTGPTNKVLRASRRTLQWLPDPTPTRSSFSSPNRERDSGSIARSVSAWLLRPRLGCSQRRSAITRDRLQRMEEPRDLVQLRNTLRVAHRRWQGRQGQGS